MSNKPFTWGEPLHPIVSAILDFEQGLNSNIYKRDVMQRELDTLNKNINKQVMCIEHLKTHEEYAAYNEFVSKSNITDPITPKPASHE